MVPRLAMQLNRTRALCGMAAAVVCASSVAAQVEPLTVEVMLSIQAAGPAARLHTRTALATLCARGPSFSSASCVGRDSSGCGVQPYMA